MKVYRKPLPTENKTFSQWHMYLPFKTVPSGREKNHTRRKREKKKGQYSKKKSIFPYKNKRMVSFPP
jgi:hypothetical protein